MEEIVSDEDIGGDTYRIDGRLTGLTGAIATFGADTTITLGKTAHGTDKGNDYVIALDNKDVLTLKGLQEADLDVTGADFIFT